MIRFFVLFSVDLDADIAAHFISHYAALQGIDEYHVKLDLCTEEEKNIRVYNLFLSAGYFVSTIEPGERFLLPETGEALPPGYYTAAEYPDGVKVPWIEAETALAKEGDFLMVADSDEFQVWDKSPAWYASQGFDVVLGTLVDCYANRLVPASPAEPLLSTFPLFHPNLSLEWGVAARTNKYLLYKKDVAVNLIGYHTLRFAQPRDIKVTPNRLEVFHFRWRENVLKRVISRAYQNPADAAGIRRFFHVPDHTA